MTDAEIKRWKPLRTRVLMGEAITETEQHFYQKILDELDRTESFPGTDRQFEALLTEVSRLRKEAEELRLTEKGLDEEIERLRAAYRDATGKNLVSAA